MSLNPTFNYCGIFNFLFAFPPASNEYWDHLQSSVLKSQSHTHTPGKKISTLKRINNNTAASETIISPCFVFSNWSVNEGKVLKSSC